MAVYTTKIFTQISGSDLTAKQITEEFNVVGKFESTISDIINTSTAVAIPTTNFGDVNKIIIKSTSCKLNITDGVGSYTIPISGIFHWTVPSTYVDTITAMTITTDSLVPIDVEVTLCGI
jgi:hypothetical protein